MEHGPLARVSHGPLGHASAILPFELLSVNNRTAQGHADEFVSGSPQYQL